MAIVANSSWNIFNFRIPVIDRLILEGFKCCLFAPSDDFSRYISSQELSFYPSEFLKNPKNLFSFSLNIIIFFLKMRTLNPAMLCSFTAVGNIFSGFYCHRTRTPHVANITGLGSLFLGSKWKKRAMIWLFKYCLKGTGVIFFQNNFDYTFFRRLGVIDNQHCEVLPGSGVDLDRFNFSARYLPAKDEGKPIVFLMISRLIKHKGVLEYLEACTRIKKSGYDVRCQIIGDIDPSNYSALDAVEFQKFVTAGVVEHVAYCSSIEKSIEECHFVVLPSYREGLPKTLLEASAIGRPMITTSVPGCRDVVVDGVNGFLIPPSESAALFRAMVRSLSLHPEEYQSMSRAARTRAEQLFDQNYVIAKYLKYARKLLNCENN